MQHEMQHESYLYRPPFLFTMMAGKLTRKLPGEIVCGCVTLTYVNMSQLAANVTFAKNIISLIAISHRVSDGFASQYHPGQVVITTEINGASRTNQLRIYSQNNSFVAGITATVYYIAVLGD